MEQIDGTVLASGAVLDQAHNRAVFVRGINHHGGNLALPEGLTLALRLHGHGESMARRPHIAVLRLEVLRDRSLVEIECLVSTEDEAFTYNKRVNRIAIIQEHRMILKAVENGVSEARIAKALNVDVASIRRRRKLLDGICAGAVELLKEKHLTLNSFSELRKLAPIRQIEAAEL